MQKLNSLTKNISLFFILIFLGNFNLQATNKTSNETKSDSILIAYLNANGIQITQHNNLKLLKSGEEKFIDLFQAIKQAKHHVHLEYFNFRNDSIANALFDLLGKKAEEGVEIRAIFDAFGNFSNNQPLKKKHLKEIRAKGIEISMDKPCIPS